MTDPRPDPANTDAIEAEALRRFLAREAGGPADPALAAWLADDPAHRRAYEALATAWDELGGLEDLAAEARRLERATAPSPMSRPNRRGALALAGGALAAGLLGVAVAPALLRGWRADHATGVGEVATRRLADGSVLTLDADSALSINMTGDGRRVELLRGRAWFAVAPDPDRPFVVRAGTGTTSAAGAEFSVGPEFSVSHVGAEVEVTVGARTVAVTLDARTETTPTRRLSAGERGRYGPDGFSPVAAIDPVTAQAWRTGKLVFEDRPLAEVVEEIARYHPGRILITDDAVAGRRVSGVVDGRDPDRALRAIVGTLPVRLQSFGPYLTLLHRA